MDVVYGPNSVDEPSLLYKLQRKIKVFNTNQPLLNRGYNLVACTSKYGLVFVATPIKTLSVYQLKELIDKDTEPSHLSVKLQGSPTHVSVNCNEEWLAVFCGQMLLVYKCHDFQNADVRPSVSIKCDVSPSNFVSSLQWNPCMPETIGIVFFDGTLLVSQVNTMQMKKIQSKARCLCWSPKGKQLVTGNSDGTLSQYKPDLSPMKTVPAPNLFDGAPVEALAIYWIATYQFAVAYKNATDNSRPAVVIVNTPKGQPQPSCANYEDICYSMGSNRPWYYYLQGLPQWNLILASSSNSMEIATLASPDGANWVQWCQSDEARPELPLTDKKQENYPVGVCIDTAAVHQIPWGENESLPPMPLLHVVSQTGLLSVFNVINLSKHAPPLCAPPQPLALPSAALTRALPDDVSAQPDPPAAVPLALPKAPPPQYHAPPPAQQPTPVQPTNVAPPTAPNVSFGMTKEPISAALQSTAPNVSFGMKKEPTPPAALEANNPAPKPTPQPPSAQAAAAILVEQEKIDKAKLNQKLKNMLIKEVNDFNMEMYKFSKLTQEKLIKLQRDIEAADLSMSVDMDADCLRKECAIDELREAVVQLKLEMVRACAVVAEARTQAEAKDLQEWTQADPLTIKRISSVKKLAYYVQTQLDHARKALDHKWNEMSARDDYGKAGGRMIRPVLDDVYQPLVKQQEILCRQAAVLRALRTTASECSSEPAFGSASLLRTTPFKNKDHLSKLTKNILNMSIEPQSKPRDSILSAQKLDVLRDILSNHKPIKIKPVSFELRQHLEAMKQRYEMAKEKTMKESRQEMEQLHIQKPEPFYPTLGQAQPQPKVEQPLTAPGPQATMFQQNIPQNNWQNDSNVFAGKTFGASTAFAYTHPTLFGSAQKPDVAKESPISIPTYTPVNVKAANPPAGVARTLFTEEKKEEKPKGFQEPPQPPQQTNDEQPKHFPPNINSYTKSQLRKFILKDLSNENNQQANEPKNDANTFMGQKICSPSFNFTKQSGTPSQPSTIFTTKFQNVTPEKVPTANPKSNETGEPDSVPVTDENKSQGDKTENKSQGDKTEKPITNMFTLKSNVTFGNKNQGIPDVLKGGQSFVFGKGGKDDKPAPTAEGAEKKETQEKQTRDVKKENETIPVQQAFNKPPAQAVIFVDLKKPAGEAKVETVPSSVFNFSTAAPPPAGAKLQFDIGPMTTQQSSVFETAKQSATQESSQKTSTDGTAHKEEAESTPTKIPEKSTPTTTFDTIPTTTSSDTTPTTTSSDTTPTTTSSDTTPTTTSSDTTPTTTSSDTTPTTTSSDAPSTTTSDTTPTTASSDTTPTTTSSDAIPIPTSSNITSTSIPTSATSTPTSEATTQNDTKDSQNVATSNAFSSTTSGSIFTAVTTSTPAFGTEETKDTKPSIFGTNTPAFGATQPSAFASNASSLFASASASAFGTQTTKSSIFSPNTTSQSASIFGTSPTTTASVFGSSPQSIFSGASTSMFGGTPTSTQNIFGTPTTQASVFGSGQSVFGSSGSPSQVFGAPATQASIFGTPTPTTQTSIFGTPTQTTQASPFGTPPATQASVFGTPTTTQGSLFGGAESNLFASATISTTSAPSQPTGNIFGGSSGSVFGNASNIFGGKPSFGTSTSAASIFGGASSFGQKPATDFWSGGGSNTGGFGTSAFGQPATTQASIFGGSGGSFSTPSSGQPFGSPGPFSGGDAKPSVFGTPPQQQGQPATTQASIFGGLGGSFSTPSSGQPFGSPGPFSGGDAKPSVFGTPPQQQASAFGGSPMFGSKPVFGGSPTFGSTGFGGFNKSPTSGFGAPAAFGGGAFGGSSFGSASPGKAFGAAAPSFGSPTQSNAMFESLATQNTLTFGNLAQQSGQAPQPAPTQHLQSPSFTGWRG